ncbi:putative inner membrane protein translocase component YidC [Candidatus Mycoplasma haematohominis]|uniref:Putative inner membrane protein translocase component YidC n=1 Tax=Candidatus Mycoplasma haematohominis TaxID=1494318 RepID=A0A478FSY7_9MOLU|nr:putative inner membrane protein translocase component YidC [Candidatus Mycoplasma haemohominis]
MKSDTFLVPFWEKKKHEDAVWWKDKRFKKFIFYLKAVLYSFSGLMIAWSFIQSFAAPYTRYHSNPGTGLEFGYLPGKYGTGKIKFDLGSWSIAGPQYHAFFEPSTVYGPFLSWFVYPVAKVFVGLVYVFDKSSEYLANSGLDVIFAMIIVMFIMRFINFWPTLRSSIYSEKQVLHQPTIDAITAKYAKYDQNDRQVKLQKHQEITAYNKKHNLKPFAALENIFITTPIFLIIFKVVTICRPIKFTVLFGLWDLSKTPSSMVFKHFISERGWLYLLLFLFIIPTNFFSQKISVILSKRRNPHLKQQTHNSNSQLYKMGKTQKIITIILLSSTFFWSTSLAIYYFFNSIFTIFQSLLIHYILIRRKQKVNLAQMKLQKLGIDV